jgi:PilZ domain-containing protein
MDAVAVNDDGNAPGPDDKRRHPRAHVDLLVSLRFPSVQQFLSVHAGNISESGMFIDDAAVGDIPREVGQMVTLRFDAGMERIVQGKARVARVDAHGLGLEFLELDENSRKLVEMIVRIQLAAG